MPKEEVFYVEIPNPVDVRRSILEASRDLLRGLQKYEELKKLRAKKQREIAAFRSVLKEINTLLNQARSSMPSVSVKVSEPPRAKEAEKSKEEKKKRKKKGKLKEAKEEKSKKPREVAELEKQLKEIEGKLSGLG